MSGCLIVCVLVGLFVGVFGCHSLQQWPHCRDLLKDQETLQVCNFATHVAKRLQGPDNRVQTVGPRQQVQTVRSRQDSAAQTVGSRQ